MGEALTTRRDGTKEPIFLAMNRAVSSSSLSGHKLLDAVEIDGDGYYMICFGEMDYATGYYVNHSGQCQTGIFEVNGTSITPIDGCWTYLSDDDGAKNQEGINGGNYFTLTISENKLTVSLGQSVNPNYDRVCAWVHLYKVS